MGPIDQMAHWQQLVIGGGLFAAITMLLMLPTKAQQLRPQPLERGRASEDARNSARGR